MAFSPTVIFITSSSRPSTALPRRAPRISLGRPTVLSQAEEVNEEVNRFTSSFKAQSNGAASVARRV